MPAPTVSSVTVTSSIPTIYLNFADGGGMLVNGAWVSVNDGTNSVLGQIASGGATTELVLSATGLVMTGTPASMAAATIIHEVTPYFNLVIPIVGEPAAQWPIEQRAALIAADAELNTLAGSGGAAVADLGSTAETIGGSAANGSAATAARSDHKHAITDPGAVIGPASATDGHLAVYDGTTGKLVKDGGAVPSGGVAVADLGGGSETVGESASNGSAATAARSDHKHAIGSLTYSDVGADPSGAAASAQSAAESASIPAAALVTSVASPGSDSNVPSEKAVRTALGAVGGGAAVANIGSTAETIGGSVANGSAATAARSDHKHAITNPGVVIGPASSVAGNVPTFSDTTGKVLQDSGVPLADITTDDVEFVIDGGGSAITTGMKGFLVVDFPCTIVSVTQLADQTGSIVTDIFACAYSAFTPGTHPGTGDKITASAPPTISSAAKSQDSTLTGWTKTIAAGTVLGFNVNSCSTIQRVTVILKVTHT